MAEDIELGSYRAEEDALAYEWRLVDDWDCCSWSVAVVGQVVSGARSGLDAFGLRPRFLVARVGVTSSSLLSAALSRLIPAVEGVCVVVSVEGGCCW